MTIIVRHPAALITAIPHLLGFEPHDSAVAVGCADGSVFQVARLDLPRGSGASPWAASASDVLCRGGARTFHLLGYDDRGRCGPDLAVLASRLRRAGIAVPEVLVVTATHWWHVSCRDLGCCPPGGTPRVPDPGVASEFVGRGSSPYVSREAMAAGLAHEAEEGARSARSVPAAYGLAEDDWAELADADHPWPATPDRIGRLAGSLRDREWRDALLAAFVPGLLGLDDLPLDAASRAARAVRPPSAAFGARVETWRGIVLDRLIVLARRSPHECAAATFTVVAVVGGMWGHGALANVALDRALEFDPTHVLARLSRQLFSLGLPLPVLSTRRADVG